MIPIMRASVDALARHVYACMMSQGGKSQALFNIAGERLDHKPIPILYIGPTRSNISTVIEPKIDHMLRSCESLWSKTVHGKKYTKTRKIVSGVTLRFAWAGSPVELAADAAGLVLVDEPDRMEHDIGGEGSIWKLADARHGSFIEGKTIGVSTPTEGNIDTYIHPETGLEHWQPADSENVISQIWRAWQTGSRHEWAWPCPECREYFIPRLKLLWWPEDASALEAERKGGLTCPHCGTLLQGDQKEWMNERGIMIAPGLKPLPYRDGDKGCYIADFTLPDPPELKRKGKGVTFVEFGNYMRPHHVDTFDLSFWVSGVANYQTQRTFGALCAEWIIASRSGEQEQVKGTLNTTFGECFKFGGDAPRAQDVAARKASHTQGSIPSDVNVVLCAVDVQKNRLVYRVRGFGTHFVSWGIEAGELWGDTARAEVWEQLDALYERSFGEFAIARMAIDSGYRADEVYGFCLSHKRALPFKGHDSLTKPFYASKIEINVRGETIKRGLQLWHFDTDYAKTWVHGRVTGEGEDPAAWWVETDITDDYCQQLGNEQRIVKPSGAVTWLKIGPNHFLDCEAMLYILAKMVRNVHVKIMAATSGPAAQATNVANPRRRRVRSKGIRT